jgi:hypothetical protein
MPGPGNNKKKASKKPMAIVHKATAASAESTTDVPANDFTCEKAYLAAVNAYHHATDKVKALRMLWEMAFGLGTLEGFEEGKERGSEEGRKFGLDEGRKLGLDEGMKLGLEEGKRRSEGDFTKAFNQGTRQGKADERKQWVEAGHCDQGICTRNSSSFVSIGVGPDVIRMPVVATVRTHESIGIQTAVDKSLSTEKSASTQFDWADDAASIPIISPLPQAQALRDFSALRSESTKPFGTLQRRYQRSQGIRRTRQRHTYPIQRTYTPQHSLPFITRYHPFGIRTGKPAITIPICSTPANTEPRCLDWDRDPQLRDLGLILQTLGWVRQKS